MNAKLYWTIVFVFAIPFAFTFVFSIAYIVSFLMLGPITLPYGFSSNFGVNFIYPFITYNGFGVGIWVLIMNSNKWWGFDVTEVINIDHFMYVALGQLCLTATIYLSITT